MGSCTDPEPWKRRDWLWRGREWNSGGLRIWIWEKDALSACGYVNSSVRGRASRRHRCRAWTSAQCLLVSQAKGSSLLNCMVCSRPESYNVEAKGLPLPGNSPF